MNRRKAFTLIELLVVIAIIALLISILLPSLAKARDLARRATCATQVRAAGQACKLYANENRDVWPTPNFAQPTPAMVNPAHAVNFVGQLGNNNTVREAPNTTAVHHSRGLFKLIINRTMVAKQFICPSTEEKPDDLKNGTVGALTVAQLGVNRFDFLGYPEMTYGYQLPFGRLGRPTEKSNPRMPLYADRGPYFQTGMRATGRTVVDEARPNPLINNPFATIPDPAQLLELPARRWRLYNSWNHNREGQNVLYADSHVEWRQSPIAGVQNDNIYTQAASFTYQDSLRGTRPNGAQGPRLETDSLIVP